MAMFQALLIASSLGWQLVKAEASAPSAGYGLNITTISSSSTSPLVAPIVRTERTAGYLDIPGNSPETSSSSWPLHPSKARTETSGESLNMPGSSTTTSAGLTYYSPRTESTQTDLDVPGSSSSTSQTLAYPSPVIAHSQSSLDIPPPPSRTDFVSQHIPTGSAQHTPAGSADSAVLPGDEPTGGASPPPETTSLPPQQPSYMVHGEALAPGSSAVVVQGTTYSIAPAGNEVYVNGVAATPTTVGTKPTISFINVPGLSIAEEAPTTLNNPAAPTPFLVDDNTITPGSPAVTIKGTTYSVPPMGSVVYINGASVQMGDSSTPPTTTDISKATPTSKTSNSEIPASSSSSSSAAAPAEQTASGGEKLVVFGFHRVCAGTFMLLCMMLQ